ncbi:MAG TPA: SDR family NAD(P)-dependent oxidoreductase, partial [Rhizomicrobium sp.]|nr:SDR family NAD(P)-dependent oxidoreductase [Rhizomicrobium sp.]
AAEQVSAALGGETLFGLVNNAGIAVAGPLLYLKIDELRHQLEVNVTGQVIVTQAFAPLLGADRSRTGKPGRIVMITSIGGKNANPFMGPYCASKFAMEGLSESLRRELMLFGIDVIVVAPGAVATPIWDKAEEVDVTQYANTPYMTQLQKIRAYMLDRGPKGLKPEKLGEAIHHALTTASPKVRYVVTPEPLAEIVQAILPKRAMDKLIGGQLGLTRK